MISCIIVFVSLSFQNCCTVEKTAVSCPEFSGRKFNTAKNRIMRNNNITDIYNLRNHLNQRKSLAIRNKRNNTEGYSSSGNSKISYPDKLELIGFPDKIRYLKKLEVSSAKGFYSQADDCDTIFLKSGSRLNVKITGTGLIRIRYRECNNPDGAINSLPKSKISFVRYGNQDSIPKNTARRKSDPVGIAGFILTIAGLPFLGSLSFALISLLMTGCLLGWISSNRIKKHPDKYKGKGLAEISIVLGYALLIFLILFVLIVLFSKIF